MNMAERYEMFIKSILEQQKVLKNDLVALSLKELTEQERLYMNTLMDYIKHGNLNIEIAQYAMQRLKKSRSA